MAAATAAPRDAIDSPASVPACLLSHPQPQRHRPAALPAPWPHRAPGGPTTPTGLRQGPATEATRTGIGWGLYQLMPASPPLAIADEREPHLAWLGSSADFR
ncbi:hypothetical protein ACCO45_000733 [Purpureocillium lilacinum]|uniref:Uncharacterized protein n=1 Tax=Purpureocillium lilacinum TaxID=33203 RepID=A0ACC4E6H2_PURLI